MAKESINIDKTVREVERLLFESDDLPPALEAAIQMLLMVVKLLADRVGLNSHNSSKRPAGAPWIQSRSDRRAR